MVIKILIIENAPFDINFINRELDSMESGYISRLVSGVEAYRLALTTFQPHIILCGHALSFMDVQEAFRIKMRWNAVVPFIVITDLIGIDETVSLIKEGVSDIIPHENITSLSAKIPAALNGIPVPESDAYCTSQKRHKSEALDALYENCMEAIVLTVTDGQILSANPAACAMFQKTEDEIIAAGRFALVDLTDGNLEKMLEERRKNGRAKGELRFRRKDESLFPGIITSVVFYDASGEQHTSLTILDISENKKTAAQLASTTAELDEKTQALNKIMDASPDIICSFDSEARFVQINGACRSIWGYEPEELIGRQCFDFICPEDFEATFHTDKEIRDGNPVNIFENRYVHKTGRIVPMLWSGKWDDGEKLIFCTAKDISEKKRLENAYEVERQQFMDLFMQAPSSIAVLRGPDHVYELANPLYLNLIGKNDIIGKSAMEVVPELQQQGIFDILNGVYATSEPFIASEMLVKFDLYGNGNLTDTYLNFIFQANRDATGAICGILLFAVDVTEQVHSRMKIEESERLYRELISELPVATYTCDADGKVMISNRAAAELWGREPVVGKDFWCGTWNIFYPNGNPVPFDVRPLVRAIREGHTTAGEEMVVERSNGEMRSVIVHVVPSFDTAGKVSGAVSMLTDISDRKKTEISLERQNKELLKANKELDRFVYSVSHDLRSPLTSVKGIIALIEDECMEAGTLEYIQMIKSSVSRLDEFIRKILSYSQNNRTSLELEIVAVDSDTAKIIRSLQNMAQAKGIHFEIDIEAQVSFTTDRLRFNTIVENLISNAIKYHRQEGGHRFIKLVGKVDDKMVWMQVTDNGIGIPHEFRDKIFDMFFRISGNSEGSGIGLYIVKDMIEKLEGTIEVHSEVGVGTAFDFTLKNFA